MPMPMSAPISACDELEGSPARQVTRFQAIAAASAATIIASETPPAGATRPPIVLATFVCNTWIATTAPTRLSTADRPMASRAPRARVLMVVATALAVSWKPLVKSKPNATAMVMTNSAVWPSGILDGDRLEDVGHVLTAVERILEQRQEFLQLDHLEGVGLPGEQLTDGASRCSVAEVLEPVHLDAVLFDALEALEVADPLLQLENRAADQSDHLLGCRGNAFDLVEGDRVPNLLDVVEDIVQSRGQRIDVLAIERRHERAVQRSHQLVCDVVAGVLQVLDGDLLLRKRRQVFQALAQQLRRGHDGRHVLVEELVEASVAWQQRKSHCVSPGRRWSGEHRG